jgi:hypothetical protein
MTRERLGWAFLAVLFVGLGVWIARNTYWTTIKVPLPLEGEAATNPFYIREKFAQALGAKTRWAQDFSLPPSTGVAYVSTLDWDLLPERRQRFEHWVESGGRLVVDGFLINSGESFETWTGISVKEADDEPPKKGPLKAVKDCRKLEEISTHESYLACHIPSGESLETGRGRQREWSLRDEDSNLIATRVRIGRGTVTVMTAMPFNGRSLLAGDNGRLFVAATQLRRGDVVHFFSETDQPSLLELAWRYGWPVIALTALALALAIWRGSVRFGPMAAPTDTARRSLAEQIRGTGQFTMRIGSTAALHAATARALNEAAARYINAFEALPGAERMQALGKATGFEASDLAAALQHSGPGRSEHLRADLELLEAARRRILLKHMRPRHGN